VLHFQPYFIPGVFADFERRRTDPILIVLLFKSDISVPEINLVSSAVLESITRKSLSESIAVISFLVTVAVLLVPHLPQICHFACWTE
jgi:hypothetical protein